MTQQSERPTKKPTHWYSEQLREEVREWPPAARQEMGRQLKKVEYGREPDDFKPMPSIGSGVNEIRVAHDGDQYRLMYVAKFPEAIYVLHVVTRKKTQKTAQSDIEIARKRYKKLVGQRKQP
jgi:phage-related protein